MKNKIIAFIGLDGTGKSTQIELLKKELNLKKKNVKVIWSRGGYTPGFNFLKKIIRRVLKKKLPKPGRSDERSEKISKPYIAKIWLTLAIFDLIILYSIYFRILVFFNFTVIADRYLYDTLIDFRLNFPKIKVENWVLWKILILVIPKPKTIYLDIPLEIALKRLEKKNEPFPDTSEILGNRLENYRKLFNSNNCIFINADNSIDAIHRKIMLSLNEN